MTKSNNEWVPEIGEKCLFKAMSRMPGFGNYTDTFTECVPVMITPHGVVLNASGTQCFMDFVDYDIEFKKLKTKAEKRREDRIVEALTYVKHDYSPDSLEMASTKEYVIDAVEQLVDADYIKPKPLTDKIVFELITVGLDCKVIAERLNAYIRGEG